MKLEKKIYTTRAEKKKDFVIGVGIFIGLNVLLYIISSLLPIIYAQETRSPPSDIVFALEFGSLCFFSYILPFLVNVGVFIYFILTRQWIALGMLGAFGFLIILGLVLGIIATVVCFATGGWGAQ